MNYGELLSRAWNIIWENKFLILLGVLVVLGGAGNGGASSSGNFNFDQQDRDFHMPQPPDLEDLPELPELRRGLRSVPLGIPVAVGLLIITLIILIGVPLWVLSTISRGGLIAGVNAIDAGGTSSFAQAFRAGWQKGWRLLGIGILPAIPGFILLTLGLVTAGLFGGLTRLTEGQLPIPPVSGAVAIIAALACLLVPIALILSLLRAFANRACMLEDVGVFAAYKRGLSILLGNFGPALLLFLIQIVVSIGIGVVMILPSIVMTLCCLLWPILILIQGGITAYFSTIWTLAWRQWTGQTIEVTPEVLT